MKMMVKVYELIKLKSSNDLESELPTIDSQEDLESVEEALKEEKTRSNLVSLI